MAIPFDCVWNPFYLLQPWQDRWVNSKSSININNTMCFAELIQETELQPLLMTIDLLSQYSGLAEATRLMMTSIGWQDEMMIAPCPMARVHSGVRTPLAIAIMITNLKLRLRKACAIQSIARKEIIPEKNRDQHFQQPILVSWIVFDPPSQRMPTPTCNFCLMCSRLRITCCTRAKRLSMAYFHIYVGWIG